MAKTLIVLGTQTTSADTDGRDFRIPSVGAKADLTSVDGAKNAARAATLGSNIRGHFSMELFDTNGDSVFVVDGSTGAQLRLSTEAGAAAAGSDHDLDAGIGHWIVDAASFATGRIVIKSTGRMGTGSIEVSVNGPLAYQEARDCAGVWNAEYKFTVTE